MAGQGERLRRGAMRGKYKILRWIGEGGFANVYAARDTVEGVTVALKVPKKDVLSAWALEDLLKEVRITSRLEHPNILPIKNATLVDGRLLIAYPLAERSLADRLRHRLSSRKCLDIAGQLLEAVAHAHGRRVIHCDINPYNVLLFPDDQVKLADFGIARVALRTRILNGSASGTVGWVAPEQALGQPSFRSDVFSVGLVIYRLFAGTQPVWPYSWPPRGIDRLRRKVRPPFEEMIQRALQVDERKRYRDAVQMRNVFRRLEAKALR